MARPESSKFPASGQTNSKLDATLSKYQEQPTLLNQHLREVLTPLTDIMISITTAVVNDTTRVSLLEALYAFSYFTKNKSRY